MTQAHPANSACAHGLQGLSVLTVGPWATDEFRNALAELDPREPWPHVGALAEAINGLTPASPPDIVLVAQPRPGMVNQFELDRILHHWPLTRIIVVAGSWCEGELRTGQPPQGVVRLYWYEFAAWWRAAMEQRAAGKVPPWAEPLLEARAAPFLSDAVASSRQLGVAIDSLDYETFDCLHQGLGALGWDAVWQPRHRPHLGRTTGDSAKHPAAGIWNGSQLAASECKALHDFCRRLRDYDAPVIALLDFPRREHVGAARAAGAAAVFAKPYQLSLVHRELVRLTHETYGGHQV